MKIWTLKDFVASLRSFDGEDLKHFWVSADGEAWVQLQSLKGKENPYTGTLLTGEEIPLTGAHLVTLRLEPKTRATRVRTLPEGPVTAGFVRGSQPRVGSRGEIIIIHEITRDGPLYRLHSHGRLSLACGGNRRFFVVEG